MRKKEEEKGCRGWTRQLEERQSQHRVWEWVRNKSIRGFASSIQGEVYGFGFGFGLGLVASPVVVVLCGLDLDRLLWWWR